MAVNSQLVAEAVMSLGVSNLQSGKEAGQKYVGRGTAGGDDVMLKLVELAGPLPHVALARARREVDLLRRVSNPNVVKAITDIVELGGPPPTGTAWLEEYLVGQDLDSEFGTQWTWDETIAMGVDLANGLVAIHAEKAVHRDLSPRNVRHLDSGPYVVMDPGVAHFIEETSLTGAWQPGSPGYMSPEHARGTTTTEASDIFAVGILMYEALTGAVPFPVGSDFDEYRRKLRDEQVTSVARVRPDLAPAQAAIVDRCLHNQSARRFLDGAELQDAFVQLP